MYHRYGICNRIEKTLLETELKTYNEIKYELQSKYQPGSFVVIIGTEVLGVWENRIDALKAGFEKYGHFNFFIRKI